IELIDGASNARTVAELELEISGLTKLEHQALQVVKIGNDHKWNQLKHLLSTPALKTPHRGLNKLVIFTEYRDTLAYLKDHLAPLLSQKERMVIIHGGLDHEARHKAQEDFRNDPETRILLATDAAGEGINLQQAHLMINYDLPWNPNRLEQRFGRIHRIGQTQACHLWNLVAGETREGAVYQRLLEKLKTEHQALDGKVFDVLGKLFLETSLADLLIEAVRYPAKTKELFTKLDNLVDRQRVSDLLERQSLLTDSMNVSDIIPIRDKMERASINRLEPSYIQEFFIRAFQELSGTIREQEPGRYVIYHVPADILDYAKVHGLGKISKKYLRVCFDKCFMQHKNKIPAVFLCPGHPLLDATVGLLLSRQRDTLKGGGIFVDERDMGRQLRVLFYIEGTIRDAHRHELSREVHFVEVIEDGTVRPVGSAPYLDYRAATEDELKQKHIAEMLLQSRTNSMDWEQIASDYVIRHLIPPHLERVRERRLELLNKTEKAVQERLGQEIDYWNEQSILQKKAEEMGVQNARLNSQKARDTTIELQERLQERKKQIAYQRQISATPPLVVGGALILPLGLLLD
ncbi:MAG: helicase-related protein, partial [Phototrophicaceae bacterium]